MSPIKVTMRRTIGMARSFYSTAIAIAAFLSVSSAIFVFNLSRYEGGTLPLSAVWALSVAPVLPALAAFIGMGVWSDERQSGRIEVLLSTSVRERDYVYGKFLGVLLMSCFACALLLASSLVSLCLFSPSAMANARPAGFVAALFALFVQCALWCSVSVAVSAIFKQAAIAACASLLLTTVVPRALWTAAHELFGLGAACGDMPLDAFVADISTGLVCPGEVVSYLILTVLMLFITSKTVMSFRFVGIGAKKLRLSFGTSVLLAVISAALAVMLAMRIDHRIDIPSVIPESDLSSRTMRILQESSGKVDVTCFMSRKHARFREVGLLLRRFKRESEARGGLRMNIGFVDPGWDIGAAERLIGRGATEGSVVFEHGRRITILPLSDGWNEWTCATAIRRLFTNPSRRNVYWTTGHGESGFDDYGTFGMSDIARDLVREGYRNCRIDLASGSPIPGNCAMILMAGVRRELSRMELDQLEAYLREGGRLMVLYDSSSPESMSAFLSAWGVRPTKLKIAESTTIRGKDVIVSEFSDHDVSALMKDARIILENPTSFSRSAAAETSADVNRVEFLPIASSDGCHLVVALERWAKAGSDLAIRPMRMVVVGDSSFAINGELSRRANANRDFFLNCVSYLSGTDIVGSDGVESGVLNVGFDRVSRLRHLMCTVGVVPLAVLLLFSLGVYMRKRHR